MIFLQLFLEFFKVGLLSIGGGLATLPFLTELSAKTGWFTAGDLANMLAVSESTPGPMGVNMATYVGFQTAGIPGGICAVTGLVAPSVIIIVLISFFLQRFRQSKVVDAVFRGLRPASTGLITAAFLQVCAIALLTSEDLSLFSFPTSIRWDSVLLAVVLFFAMQEKHLKKLHPIVLIAASALLGIVFQM